MMKLPAQMFAIVFASLFVISAGQGYEENSYDQPPSKMKFNIGFNLPSMSISLPKLELPQISIKASVKNKKPFTLKLPVIKFNGYANSEEDNSYGGGESGGYGGGNSGGGYGGNQNAPAYGPGPTAYASMAGANGYVQATPDAYSGAAQSGGYERPAAGGYSSSGPSAGYGSSAAAEGNSYGQTEPAYASSGYAPATQQAPSSAYTKPQTVQQPQVQHQYQQTPAVASAAAAQTQPQTAYQIQNSYQPSHHQQGSNVYQSPSRSTVASQVVNSSPYTGTLPTAAANGYFVPRPVTSHHSSASLHPQQPHPVPSYRDEPKISAPVQLYQSGVSAYSGNANSPYESTPEQPSYSPASTGQYGYASFKRRSNRLTYPNLGAHAFETSATLPEGRYVLAPVGDETLKWQPIFLRV